MHAAASDRAPRSGVSHVVGDTEPLLSELTMGQWLDATAAQCPNRTACAFCEQNLRRTWVQPRDEADHFAAGLL
jgi:fatty-acyl-CoA synthase